MLDGRGAVQMTGHLISSNRFQFEFPGNIAQLPNPSIPFRTIPMEQLPYKKNTAQKIIYNR